MNIIKRGTQPAETIYRLTCDICDTVFEFKKAEAKIVPDHRDGDFLQIGCPVCEHSCTHAI